MAENGSNYRFIYIYSGRVNVWLSIVARLYLLVCSLLYSSTGDLGLLDLVNGAIYSLAPDSLILELAGGRPDKPPFLLFWRIFVAFINYNTLYIGFGKNILINTIFEL